LQAKRLALLQTRFARKSPPNCESEVNCRCARGARHTSLYLVQSHSGKMRQICVPKAWEDRVRQAVQDYQQMQRLIEEVSELEWKRLRERKP